MTKTERPIKFIYWTVTEVSLTKCSEGLVICLTLLAITVGVERSHRRVPTGHREKWSDIYAYQ